jgi:hypothetical protein
MEGDGGKGKERRGDDKLNEMKVGFSDSVRVVTRYVLTELFSLRPRQSGLDI